jgi:ABC-2 type transport system ATP-binding protein
VPEAAAVRVIGCVPGVEAVTRVDGQLEVAVDPEQAAAINRVLVRAGIEVSELYADKASLEDVFLQLTGGER